MKKDNLIKENISLQAKYNITAWFYDILDYPWERQYRHWRPELLQDVRGLVCEAGVGTGRNLPYYNPDASVTGIDLSRAMLKRALRRSRAAKCYVRLIQEDATTMRSLASGAFDWCISTFLCCVMPDHLQPLAVSQFERILKPGGRFRILEIVYSKYNMLRIRQKFLAPFVEKVYGARFDRNTYKYIKDSDRLFISNTYFIKSDTYMVIEGFKKEV